MFIITALRDIDLHPMNYFFLATAFFAFHLLLAYLVDHISILAAMAISSLVSVLLVVSYLRLVVGMRFAALGGRNRAIDLPRAVFLCILLARLHGPFDHDHRHHHAVRGDASHGAHSLVRALCGAIAQADAEHAVAP